MNLVHGSNATAATFRGESLLRDAWQVLDFTAFVVGPSWRASTRTTARRHGSRVGRALAAQSTREMLVAVWGQHDPDGSPAVDPAGQVFTNLAALGAILGPQPGDPTPVGELAITMIGGLVIEESAWVPEWTVVDRGCGWAQVSAQVEIGVFA